MKTNSFWRFWFVFISFFLELCGENFQKKSINQCPSNTFSIAGVCGKTQDTDFMLCRLGPHGLCCKSIRLPDPKRLLVCGCPTKDGK